MLIMDWLTANLGSIVVGLVVALIVAAIIVKLIRDKRKGKALGCDCGCSGCDASAACAGNAEKGSGK
jgi:hypothetical protein